MRRLVAIGVGDDAQTTAWSTLASDAGVRTRVFLAEDYGSGWDIELTDERVHVRDLRDGAAFDTADESVCWYLRGPGDGKPDTLNGITILHESLVHRAYRNGNFFAGAGVAAELESSKLNQAHVWSATAFPTTRTALRRPLPRRTPRLVVKSISPIRSIAVDYADERLGRRGSAWCPVLLQDRVDGLPIKVHFYRRRRGDWSTFAAAVTTDEVDYRYGSDPRFVGVPPTSEWLGHAERIFGAFACRFFDVDLIRRGSREFFLEVNFSPVPTYYEWNLLGGLYYSACVLRDWLGR